MLRLLDCGNVIVTASVSESVYNRLVPGDAALVERIRESLPAFRGEAGLSAWNGFAMARFCAQDAASLRADMMAVLGCASAVPLPRLWLN